MRVVFTILTILLLTGTALAASNVNYSLYSGMNTTEGTASRTDINAGGGKLRIRGFPITVECWVNIKGTKTSHVFLSIESQGDSALKTVLQISVEKTRAVKIKIGSAAITGSLLVPLDVPTHISVSVPAGGNGTLYLWDKDNGQRTESLNFGSPAWPAWNGTNTRVYLGRNSGGINMYGWVDDVRLWYAAVSGRNIASWRNRVVDSNHPDWRNLNLYYKIDEGTGKTLKDSSLTPYNLAINTGAKWEKFKTISFGPFLRKGTKNSVALKFAADEYGTGTEGNYRAGIMYGTSSDLSRAAVSINARETTFGTNYASTVSLSGLSSDTTYYYAPVIDGRPVVDEASYSFHTLPDDTGGLFIPQRLVFFADQHVADRDTAENISTYNQAISFLRVEGGRYPVQWFHLGDFIPGVAPTKCGGMIDESHRSLECYKAILKRNYGTISNYQNDFAGNYFMNGFAVSDHDAGANNYSMNWAEAPQGWGSPFARLGLNAMINQYDVGYGLLWDYILDQNVTAAAADNDFGESVMVERKTQSRLVAASGDYYVCIADAGSSNFAVDDRVVVSERGKTRVNSYVAAIAKKGTGTRCTVSGQTELALKDNPGTGFTTSGVVTVGAKHSVQGHYGTWAYGGVRYYLLDTTTYRGDTYESSEYYTYANKTEIDHSSSVVVRDQAYGSNATIINVRSWLGPTQRDWFLKSLNSVTERVVIIMAGYPLKSLKFDMGPEIEGGESGQDFTTEMNSIISKLKGVSEKNSSIILWVHGDGHIPEFFRLARNIYQCQIGNTISLSGPGPGHHSEYIKSGEFSTRQGAKGAYIIERDVSTNFTNDRKDHINGYLDNMEAFMAILVHPGEELFIRMDDAHVTRVSNSVVRLHFPVTASPATPYVGSAQKDLAGKVARLKIEGIGYKYTTIFSMADYKAGNTYIDANLSSGVATADVDNFRVIMHNNPYVNIRWFDSSGDELNKMQETLYYQKKPLKPWE